MNLFTPSANPRILARLSLMMFLQFFIWGSWYVTLSNYLVQIGFDGILIGRVYLMNNIGAIIAPFIIGMIADRFFSSQKVMGVLHLAGAAFMYFSSELTTAGPLILFMLLYNLSYMPTLALVNAISFQQIDRPDLDFPKIRVWGSLGWIASGLTILAIQTWWMPDIEASNAPMKIASILSLILGLYSFTLPNTPPKMKGMKVSIGEVLGLKALRLFKDRNFSLFALASFLISIPLAFYYVFTNPFFNESGMTGVAGKMSMGQMSEVFFMILIPFFFKRLGVKKMLLFGMLAWVIRYVLFAMGDNDTMVWMFYGGILLHGVCYDFFFVTGQIYVDNKAPQEVRASAQGLVTLLTYGLGIGLGTEIAGRVFSYYSTDTGRNWEAIWWVPCLFAVGVLILFAIGFKDEGSFVSSEKTQEVEPENKN